MSTFWTPQGERPIKSSASEPSRPADPAAPDPAPAQQVSEDEMRARMAQLRDELARTPPEVIIANHAYGIFELATLHLSLQPPQLEQARLAIDAFATLVEGLGDRLGEPAGELRSALSQLRMAYVQLHSAHGGAGPAAAPDGSEGA